MSSGTILFLVELYISNFKSSSHFKRDFFSLSSFLIKGISVKKCSLVFDLKMVGFFLLQPNDVNL